jgi:hypothetical protein
MAFVRIWVSRPLIIQEKNHEGFMLVLWSGPETSHCGMGKEPDGSKSEMLFPG